MRSPAAAASLMLVQGAVASGLTMLTGAAQNVQFVAGTVVDPQDTPVPAVQVSLIRSGFRRQTRTSADGNFRFERVPAAEYELHVSLVGFEPIRRRVRMSANQPLSVVLRLSLAQHRDELIVRSEAPVVNLDASGNRDAVSVQRGLLDNLPVLDQNYVQTLSRFLDPAGGPGGSPTLIVDAAESRNGGAASAIQEIRINQNPYTAEYPRWSRRRIEVITKAGTDKYHGTFNLLVRNYHLNARDPLAVLRPPEERRLFEASLFGPIGSGKTKSFLLSRTQEAEDLQSVVFAIGPAEPVRENVATPQRNTQASVRLSRQFSDRNAAFWQLNYQDQFFYNRGASGTVLPEAATNHRFREDEALFNHRLVVTPRPLSQVRILFGRYFVPTVSVRNERQVVISDAFTGGGALNQTNYLTYIGAISSPLFGRAVSAQPPRRLELGARFQV
ncbi:MAG TPA: carboxypeptidase-like regulatory domain-containing protein [Bryobacteraceae bacterium]|nr:carboxypeptidase-like regulatory domain-containing protein [Bryobacteraceae bacterium]